jgi:lipoate---protein ligase
MRFLDLTCPTPAENLAWDEALLDLCEEHGTEVLRLWESSAPFVVVGYGNSVVREVFQEQCAERGIPILRRCSGGGTVVQGPGCLSYNLTLRIDSHAALQTVTATNDFIMQRNRAALESIVTQRVSVQGCTDLAFEEGGRWWKFSGNAQRRRRRALVFHGTILHSFDLGLVGQLLRFPSSQPGYRSDRPHSEFVRNLPAGPSAIRDALRHAWSAEEAAPKTPPPRITELLQQHYLNDDWNLRR